LRGKIQGEVASGRADWRAGQADRRGDRAEQAVLNSLAGTLDLGIDYPLPTANSMPSQETSPTRPPVP
jgi:hypothetical protein